MKKRLSILLTIFAILFMCAVPALAENPIYLEINGEIVTSSAAPVIENGTTLVPIRIISQNLGCTVDWNANTQGITITKDSKVINLTIGETAATVNNAAQSLSVAPKIIDSTTMVPIRFISQNLDAYVNWDEASRTVQVSKTNNFAKPNVPTTPAKPVAVTMGEKNALAKAKSYLEFTAFSYEGLIGQLEYEGFSASEAKYGAENCGANWNEQAAKKAKSYLELTAFSRQGLIDQLKYEGFTTEQVEYGVKAVGY